ncbi:MAG: hypothetical protein WBW81_11510 [Methylocella sp.]
MFKSHKGVQKEFLRLTNDDPRFDMELRAYLGRAYNLKAIADYETGPGSQLPAESAHDAIQAACRFVECVAGLVTANGNTQRAPDAEAKPLSTRGVSAWTGSRPAPREARLRLHHRNDRLRYAATEHRAGFLTNISVSKN